MTIQQIEAKFIELKHREPFVPFLVELADGRTEKVTTAGLAITDTGAGFIGADGAIVDIDFGKVRSIKLLNAEAAA